MSGADDAEALRSEEPGSAKAPVPDERGPEVAAAVVRARIAARIAEAKAARARVASHQGGAATEGGAAVEGDAEGGAAAEGDAADEEAVHDYRVALRRLRSALRALRPAWGKRALVPLEDELKALADATGDVRDEEVLQETLAELELDADPARELARWSEGRARRLQGARAKAARKLAGPELGDRLAAALDGVEAALAAPMRRPMALDELRRRSIGRMLEEVAARASDTAPSDVEGMHKLRIRIKRLRYAIELLIGDDATTEVALKAASKLQKRLGSLHDVDEALARMGRSWGLPGAVRASIAAGLRDLRIETERKAQRDLAAFVPELERELGMLLGPVRA